MKIKKGDLCRYTGTYAPGVPVAAHYGPGRVVGFRDAGTLVTVRLVDKTEERYADWPVSQTEKEDA